MSVGRICPGCKRVVMPNERHACAQSAAIAAADNQRRHSKQRAHGRGRARWLRLRRLALERDGYRCMLRVDAGCTGVATSVHLRAELQGNHELATLDDCTSGCAHCHGVVDAPRATAIAQSAVGRRRGRGLTAAAATRPAPGAPCVLATPAVTSRGNA